ncbi:MAG: hypothetical protein KDA05_01895, partial [Phycisphaerales bacterium]|nr:hypothetical protein [Phycisphaerales bacterium]
GVTLDPLVGLDDDRMALRSRLLAVPELRERYLAHVREIAEADRDGDRLGPRIDGSRNNLESSVAEQTRGLSSHDAFMRVTGPDATDADAGSLREFALRRRAFLLGEEPASNARTGGIAPNR